MFFLYIHICRADEVTQLSTSHWFLVFFIGWPVGGGGGDGTASDKSSPSSNPHSRPSLSSNGNGGQPQEGIRDTADVHHRVSVEKTQAGNGTGTPAEEFRPSLGHISEAPEYDETEPRSNTAMAAQKGKSTQDVGNSTTRPCPATVPLITRRNTVARCTGVVKDVRESSTRRSSLGNCVLWEEDVRGSDAATDLEFSALMNRVGELRGAEHEEREGNTGRNRNSDRIRDTEGRKEREELDSPPLTRETASRKSLPASALKSYMRGTRSSVLKTRDGNAPQPDIAPPTSRQNKSPSTTGSTTTTSIRRKKLVSVKPSIPPVLLRRSGVVQKCEDETSSSIKSSDENESDTREKDADDKSRGDGSQTVTESGDGRSRRLSSPPQFTPSSHCRKEGCSNCLLVDLWFTIWHVELNKK